MRIGVLGLGRMGSRIADAWRADGYDVTGWDADSTPASVRGVDVLVTVLPGSAEVAASEGLIGTLGAEALWLDLTSSDPSVVDAIVERTGVAIVGAPMGGGPSAVDARSVHFFVGGDTLALERVRRLLEAVGSVEHIGQQVGAGYSAKLITNLLWFGQVVAVTEALLLGRALGLAPADLARTLRTTAAGSVFLDDYVDSLLEGDYLENFGIDRVVEELDVLAALAARHDVPFELSTLVARLHREALERFGAVPGELLAAQLLEQRAGLSLHSPD